MRRYIPLVAFGVATVLLVLLPVLGVEQTWLLYLFNFFIFYYY